MKITPEEFAHILAAIRPLESRLNAHAEALAKDSRVKSLPMRLRWDAFWSANLSGWASEFLYKRGCNDKHIDTALREVMKQLGFPEFAK